MNDERLVKAWRNGDGTYGARHASVEVLRQEATNCASECSCWRHRVVAFDDLWEWEAEVELSDLH